MEGLVGIFNSRSAAEGAVRGLHEIGLAGDAIVFLTPGGSPQKLESMPTTDAESPGMGKAISGYVGGVIGGSLGLGAGAAVATLVVPGAGPVFAAGVGAAALLGLGGAAAGAALGQASEEALEVGVPPRRRVLLSRTAEARSLVGDCLRREPRIGGRRSRRLPQPRRRRHGRRPATVAFRPGCLSGCYSEDSLP